VGPMSDSGVLAPDPHLVGPAKAGMTKPMKCFDATRIGCSTSSR
jgi:alkylation response protein AidB-like acyl-CoA dehydrogenase